MKTQTFSIKRRNDHRPIRIKEMDGSENAKRAQTHGLTNWQKNRKNSNAKSNETQVAKSKVWNSLQKHQTKQQSTDLDQVLQFCRDVVHGFVAGRVKSVVGIVDDVIGMVQAVVQVEVRSPARHRNLWNYKMMNQAKSKTQTKQNSHVQIKWWVK